jgi:hypothetical protein
VLEGQSCPLAADADAVVVHVRPDDATWRALVDAHARLHPGVPIVVEDPGGASRSLVALAPRLARTGQAARSAT